MELRHLRYFVAVADERHFGRAAERLGIRQPPLSQQIQALERELGTSLFHRVPRKLELTEAGAVLLENARAILSNVERTVREVERAGRGETGHLCIGFTVGSSFSALVPASIRAFQQQYPQISVVLRERDSAVLFDDVVRGDVDVAFVRPPAPDPERILTDKLLDEPMLVVLPENHRLAADAFVDLCALSGDRFVLYPRQLGPAIYDVVIAACHDAGFLPNVIQEAPQVSSTINLVGAGFGVSIVPESLQQIHTHGVVYRPIRGQRLRAPLSLASRRGEAVTTVRNFIKLVKRAASRVSNHSLEDREACGIVSMQLHAPSA